MANHPTFQYPLDHFEFYVLRTDRSEPVEVKLRGQFDRRAIPARVYGRRYFAPATDKNGEGIRDKNAHLTWYVIESGGREPYRTVRISNQFGKQKYRLAPPRGLLVPSQKRGHDRPERLDHFKVYPVVHGDFEPRQVRLRNQFEERHHTVEVERPAAFAVPVGKSAAGHRSRIVNREAHLMIYWISPHSFQGSTSARDQFGEYKMRLLRSVFLAVPTKKIDWGN